MPLLRPDNPTSPFEATLLRKKTIGIILSKSFSKGEYTLSSGEVSNYYFNMKPTMLDPEGIDALSQLVLVRLMDMRVDYIGGLELGAVPLLSPIAALSYLQKIPVPGFVVRKEVKDHGTMKLIEGVREGELKGRPVVVLDDVTTTGKSAMIAVEAAQAAGARVLLVLSIVDRQEGAAQFFQEASVPFDWLFGAEEFIPAD